MIAVSTPLAEQIKMGTGINPYENEKLSDLELVLGEFEIMSRGLADHTNEHSIFTANSGRDIQNLFDCYEIKNTLFAYRWCKERIVSASFKLAAKETTEKTKSIKELDDRCENRVKDSLARIDWSIGSYKEAYPAFAAPLVVRVATVVGLAVGGSNLYKAVRPFSEDYDNMAGGVAIALSVPFGSYDMIQQGYKKLKAKITGAEPSLVDPYHVTVGLRLLEIENSVCCPTGRGGLGLAASCGNKANLSGPKL